MTRRNSKGLANLMRAIALPASCGFALLCVVTSAPDALAYPLYDDPASTNDCHSCHSGFKGGNSNLLHASHVGNLGITQCNLCHPSGGGSKPVRTYTSGSGGGLGCAGCHGQDFGETSPNSGQPKATAYGLRLFHVAQGVTACGTGGCHQPGSLGHSDPFPPSLGEAVAPPYYSLPNNNLSNSCASYQEDITFDADSVGLDNDGDGAVDWPADADCAPPPSTTTTTSTSTTTTTLPVQCGAAPALGCVAAGKSLLLVNEKAAGKEKVKVSLSKLQSAVTQGQFGDPVDDDTNYAICIYDDANQLKGEISVSRAGANCGSPPAPCWADVSTKGYKYLDKLTTADGILKITMSGGDLGKGKIVLSGKNNAAKAQTSLPTGIAASLQSNTQATVQVLTSDASCFGATVTQVKTADGVIFNAVGP